MLLIAGDPYDVGATVQALSRFNDFATALRWAMNALHGGDSQQDVAAFVNRWMEDHGYDLYAPQMSTSQASVSKWMDPKILAKPIPAKRPALAAYLQTTLGEVWRLCGDVELAPDVKVLQGALVDAKSKIRLAEMRNSELAEALAEVDQKLLAKQRAYDRLRARVTKAERALEAAQADLVRRRAGAPRKVAAG